MNRISPIVGVVSSELKSSTRHDGDFSDRLCYPYASMVFCAFAFIVSTKQFVGDPIQCWVPAHFSGNQEDYVNDFCWLGNTYYVSTDDDVPKENDPRTDRKISYYHWIPIMLLVQALLFYFPRSVWMLLSRRSGVDMEDLVNSSQTFIHLEMEATREKTMQFMTRQMDRYLSLTKRNKSKVEGRRTASTGKDSNGKRAVVRCCYERSPGGYLTGAYLFVKVFSLGNVLGQLFFLNTMLGTGFHLYGFEVLSRIIRGEDHNDVSPRFPRLTMCDFKVRRLGNVHRYTVQCVLPINLFNEKIYLFIWLWMIFLAFALVRSIVAWAVRVFPLRSRRHYVEGHLSLMPRDHTSPGPEEYNSAKFDRFLRTYLRYDGIFILRLIGHNTSSITVAEMVIALWGNYKEKSRDGDGDEDDDDEGRLEERNGSRAANFANQDGAPKGGPW